MRVMRATSNLKQEMVENKVTEIRNEPEAAMAGAFTEAKRENN